VGGAAGLPRGGREALPDHQRAAGFGRVVVHVHDELPVEVVAGGVAPELRLGFGRIIVSDIEPPSLLVHLV
jgi:hypothetical protein